jgi:hypothetical protein
MTVYTCTTLFNIVQQTSLHRKSFFHKNKRVHEAQFYWWSKMEKNHRAGFELTTLVENQTTIQSRWPFLL